MILILGGTSDTHKFIKDLKYKNYVISVATDYGFSEFSRIYPNRVLKIRFDMQSLENFVKDNGIVKIVDTTHPYAVKITSLSKKVAHKLEIDYIDAKRSLSKTPPINYDKLVYFDSIDELKCFLSKKCSMIFFTIGSNKLELFREFFNKGYFRILPFEDSIKKCKSLGIEYARLIAMQGPFSKELNIALIKEIGADCIVSKNSGKSGGILEKIQAAQEAGIYIAVLDLS
jgi:precorrin-6A/cobalt-precorrin-6A reductase